MSHLRLKHKNFFTSEIVHENSLKKFCVLNARKKFVLSILLIRRRVRLKRLKLRGTFYILSVFFVKQRSFGFLDGVFCARHTVDYIEIKRVDNGKLSNP